MAASFKDDHGPFFWSENSELTYEILSSCTRSKEIRVCQLQCHLAECNAILWYSGVALTEDPHDNVGEIRLMRAHSAARRGCFPENLYTNPPWLKRRQAAIDVITIIITNHRCIVGVELNDVLAKQIPVVKSLAQMRSLRILRICDKAMSDPEISKQIYELCRAVNNTAEQALSLQRLDIAESQSTILTQVPPYEHDRLTSLDMSQVRMTSSQAENFIDALMNNKTISELSVRSCVAVRGRTESSASFIRYLAKADGRLKKLVLNGCFFFAGSAFKTIVQTIAELKSLQELDAGMCRADHTVLFADVVAKNRSLQSLRLIPPKPCDHLDLACGSEAIADYYYVGMLPWFPAIRQNTVLSRLAIDMLGFGTYDCCNFLRAVADNENLASVVIASLPVRGNLAEILLTIQKLGLTERITILDHVVKTAALATLPGCSLLTTLTIDYDRFPSLGERRMLFNCLLNNWDHVTSLRVYVNNNSVCEDMINILATYIEKSAALQDFKLHLDGDYFYEPGRLHQDPNSDSPLVRKLCAKRNIRRICFENVKLSDTECKLLAETIAQSTRLSELKVAVPGFCDDRLLRHLFKIIERNYSLLCITLPICCFPLRWENECQWRGDPCIAFSASPPPYHEVDNHSGAAILDFVTCRNAKLLMQAARFAMGENDRGGARALELVSEHPKLVETIQERALVGAAEAETMITEALRRLQFATLHEFMKHAGVIYKRVQRADDSKAGTTHLCDLNEYCWRSIRKYLSLADVKEETAASAKW